MVVIAACARRRQRLPRDQRPARADLDVVSRARRSKSAADGLRQAPARDGMGAHRIRTHPPARRCDPGGDRERRAPLPQIRHAGLRHARGAGRAWRARSRCGAAGRTVGAAGLYRQSRLSRRHRRTSESRLRRDGAVSRAAGPCRAGRQLRLRADPGSRSGAPSSQPRAGRILFSMIRVATLLALSAVASGAAGQWPEFRGPTGQGQSAERGLPVEWSESSNIIWKVPVAGSGWSSPVIADGRVWLTTAVEAPPGSRSVRGVSLRTVAFDERTGREIVNVEVFHVDHPGALNPKNSRASPTPIVDGDRVYVHFGADGTAALSAAGDIVWRARLLYESQHGSGGSPALYHDLLSVNADGGSEAFVAALDTHTGKVRWKAPRRQP